MVYGFNEKKTAQRLKSFANKLNDHRVKEVKRPVGTEMITVKITEEDGIEKATEADQNAGTPASWEKGTAVEILVRPDGEHIETSTNVEVFNSSDEKLEEDDIVQVVRQEHKWVFFQSPAAKIKRFRFKLLGPIQVDTPEQSGWADAEVIDPLTSGLSMGETVKVYDPRKEFCFAFTDSIGWATKGIGSVIGSDSGGDSGGGSPGDDPIGCCTFVNSEGQSVSTPMTEAACDGQTDGTWSSEPCSGGGDDSGEAAEDVWIIESCTQLVTRIKATTNGCLAPWAAAGQGGSSGGGGTDAIPELTIIGSESYWPYVMWHPDDESPGATLDGNVHNPKKFATASGVDVWLERRESLADTQVEDGTVVPYSDNSPEYYWVIVAVGSETANYAKISHDGAGQWSEDVSVNSDYFDGTDPRNGCTQGARAPEWFSGENNWCAVPNDIKGIGRLDKDTGEYVLISTFSGFFGPGNLTKVVGSPMDDVGSLEAADDLIFKPEGDSPGNEADSCGKFAHKVLKNIVTFGGPEGTGCPMEFEDPDPEIDFSGYDQTIVTGLTTNSSGDLELETKQIKTMCQPEDGDNIPFPYSTTDIVQDIYCADGTVHKNYTGIKYIGSPQAGSGASGVPLPCTNPTEYDWCYIWENHISNQECYHVDYYDITYPEGCEPCPTGCCTYTDENGETVYKEGITKEACEESGNYTDGTWSEGPCPCNCCKTVDGTGFETYQNGLTAEECAALVTDPPTGSGSDIVSAECISECPPEPTGCCYVSEGDYRPNKTQEECVTGLGGTWSEGEDCPEVGCCVITYTDGSGVNITTTQALCDGYDGGIHNGINVDTAVYQGNGTTCGTCTTSNCCCGNVIDVEIDANCPPGPGGPGGGGGATSYFFTQTGGGIGVDDCNWSVEGVWTIDGVNNVGSLSVSHTGGGCFAISGTAPDGSSVSGDSCTGNVTVGSCSGMLQLSHTEEQACIDGN
jgi:hypothetical protein